LKIVWLGEPSGPDEITMFGLTFERKGDPVEIPDDHPRAKVFAENHHFKVEWTNDSADGDADAGADAAKPRRARPPKEAEA